MQCFQHHRVLYRCAVYSVFCLKLLVLHSIRAGFSFYILPLENWCKNVTFLYQISIQFFETIKLEKSVVDE